METLGIPAVATNKKTWAMLRTLWQDVNKIYIHIKYLYYSDTNGVHYS